MAGMMGKMMHSMMGNMMHAESQDDVPFLQGILQQSEELELTPDQIQQLQTLVHETRKALIRHEAEVQVAELDVEALMRAEPVDLAQVKEVVRRVETQRTEMRLARLQAMVNAKALLTPEQRQHVSTQTAETSQDMSDMMGCPMMGKMMG